MRVSPRIQEGRPSVGVSTSAAAAEARREFRPRAWWSALVVSIAFAVLAGRLYQLQILRGEEYKERADENFVKELRVPADRGPGPRPQPPGPGRLAPLLRRDAHALLLRQGVRRDAGPAGGAARPRRGRSIARARERLAAARGLDRFRPFTVKVDIPREELDVVEAHRVPGAFSGVDVIPAPHRNYRYGAWASHLFGYMNEVGAEELKKANAGASRSAPRTS